MDFAFEAIDAIEDMRKMFLNEINTYPLPSRSSLQRTNSTSLQKTVKKSDDKKPDDDYTARANAVDHDQVSKPKNTLLKKKGLNS